jgi:hypothetical protein
MHVVARYGRADILLELMALWDELAVQRAPGGPELLHSRSGGTELAAMGLACGTSSKPASRVLMSDDRTANEEHVRGVGCMRGVGARDHHHHNQHTRTLTTSPSVGGQDGTIADVTLPDKQQLVNLVNARRQTPLIIAASRGHADVVKLLIGMVRGGGLSAVCVRGKWVGLRKLLLLLGVLIIFIIAVHTTQASPF